MKYIKLLLMILFVFSSCHGNSDIYKIIPEYKLIERFSEKIEKEKDITLYSYGINNNLPKEYSIKKSVASFFVHYIVRTTQKELVSLEDARSLIVSIAESLLDEINHDPEVMPRLDTYPCLSNMIHLHIEFEDEQRAGLGNGGVQRMYLSNGEIKYKRYEIRKYDGRDTLGKNIVMHEENYADALQLVEESNQLILF